MPKVINGECGHKVEGADDDELVANAQQHVQQEHPEMAGEMTRERILGMATEA